MYSDDFIEKMVKDGVIVGYAGDFHFGDEVLRNHTGVGEVNINGNIYYGVGEFGSMGSVESVADANPASVEVTLQGIPGTVYNQIMQNQIRGSKVVLYKVIYNSDTGLVEAAAEIVVGAVTDYSWAFSDSGVFSIQIADEFNLYERPLQKYYTHHSWSASNPGDDFWQFVAQMAGKELHWGSEQDGSKFTKN